MTAEIETPVFFANLSAKGEERYAELLPQLDPSDNDRYIAIEVETGEYAIARSTAEAMRAMHKRHPFISLYLRRIGDTPEPELARRLFDITAKPGETQK